MALLKVIENGISIENQIKKTELYILYEKDI